MSGGETATGGEDRDILLVPGFMCDAGLWDEMRETLGQIGPLHHADLSRGDTIADMAAQLLPHAPRRFLLIGFSMGGTVARHVAISCPGRVTGLVLINSSARGDTREQRSHKRDMVAIARRSTFRGHPRRALRSSVHPDRIGDEALLDRIQAMALRLGRDTFLRQLALERHDERGDLERIRCPTLVIASRQDRLRSLAEAEELAAGIDTSAYHVLENCGHMAPFEQPRALARTISDWAGRRLPAEARRAGAST